MKNYFAVLACYTAIMFVSVLVGTVLATHMPWWALIPMVMISVCGCAYIDFRRFFGDNK